MPSIVINKRFLNSVAAGATDTFDSPALPNNRVILIWAFGGYDPRLLNQPSGTIGLLWGTVGNFELVRAGGDGVFSFDLKIELKGDGVKFLRLIRQNSGGVAKPMYAWFDALVK